MAADIPRKSHLQLYVTSNRLLIKPKPLPVG